MSETILNMLPLTEEEKAAFEAPPQRPSTSMPAAAPPLQSSLPKRL